MNFRRGPLDEPDINLIPFIDILLVVLIFLMLSTTFSPWGTLAVRLPQANSATPEAPQAQLRLVVGADGQVWLNGRAVDSQDLDQLGRSMLAAGAADAVILLSADANASHQSVLQVMDAARRAGLSQLHFAAQALRP